jgi:hypothetical protein
MRFLFFFLESINEIIQSHDKEAKKEVKRRRDNQKGGKCLLKGGKMVTLIAKCKVKN